MPIFVLLALAALAAVFISSGWQKLRRPDPAERLVASLFPRAWLGPTWAIRLLSLSELVLGSALALGHGLILTSALVLGAVALGGFTFVLRAAQLRFVPCGCSGNDDRLVGKADYARNALLLFLVLLLVVVTPTGMSSINPVVQLVCVVAFLLAMFVAHKGALLSPVGSEAGDAPTGMDRRTVLRGAFWAGAAASSGVINAPLLLGSASATERALGPGWVRFNKLANDDAASFWRRFQDASEPLHNRLGQTLHGIGQKLALADAVLFDARHKSYPGVPFRVLSVPFLGGAQAMDGVNIVAVENGAAILSTLMHEDTQTIAVSLGQDYYPDLQSQLKSLAPGFMHELRQQQDAGRAVIPASTPQQCTNCKLAVFNECKSSGVPGALLGCCPISSPGAPPNPLNGIGAFVDWAVGAAKGAVTDVVKGTTICIGCLDGFVFLCGVDIVTTCQCCCDPTANKCCDY